MPCAAHADGEEDHVDKRGIGSSDQMRHQSGMAQNQPNFSRLKSRKGCHAPRMPTVGKNMWTNAPLDRPSGCAAIRAWRRDHLGRDAHVLVDDAIVGAWHRPCEPDYQDRFDTARHVQRMA